MHNTIQVEFKALRKDYFYNKNSLTVKSGDHVIVQAESGRAKSGKDKATAVKPKPTKSGRGKPNRGRR